MATSESLIRVWNEASKEVRKASNKEKTKTEKILFALWVIASVIFVAAYVAVLVGFYFKDAFVQNLALIILVISLIALAIVGRRMYKPKTAIEQLSGQKDRYTKVRTSFMQKTGISTEKLSVVRGIISSYVQEKEASRKTVTSRAFSGCISGIFVSGLALLVQSIDKDSMFMLQLAALLCVTGATAALLAGPIWDMNDMRKKDSLFNAKDMLSGLEFDWVL